ncbi:hypothetical protein EVAR_5819_1 [Eumeta japonica]|uniref:Uncharacterized protein n=1 Tax=Eumeta variegata TaxID=151549 RepID=A0A4C1T5C4_EUMVA|nr:hypothetical protein EVAR_5819_1 [Eumeta japonica]
MAQDQNTVSDDLKRQAAMFYNATESFQFCSITVPDSNPGQNLNANLYPTLNLTPLAIPVLDSTLAFNFATVVGYDSGTMGRKMVINFIDTSYAVNIIIPSECIYEVSYIYTVPIGR